MRIPLDSYHYLGMAVHRSNDSISVRAKSIQLKSQLKGRVDIVLRNMSELKNFLEENWFNKSHLLAFTNAVYCPQGHLSAIYNCVAKSTQGYIHENFPMQMYTTKIHQDAHPVILKLAKLYFLTQGISLPRFCLSYDKLNEFYSYLIAFSDGSAVFSAACTYIISANKNSDESKVLLIATLTKLQTATQDDSITVKKKQDL